MELHVTAFGMNFQNGLMNAGGTVKTTHDFKKMMQSDIGAILIGSITPLSRSGNDGTTWDARGLNSLGMPNPGFDYWFKQLPEIAERAKQAGKNVVINIAAFKNEDYISMAMKILDLDLDNVIIEINFGCPNIIDGNNRKPIYSFNLPLMQDIIGGIYSFIGYKEKQKMRRIVVKLSPYSNPDQLLETIEGLNDFPIGGYTLSNTFPKCLMYNSEGKPAISPDGGLGGLSGHFMKPIALGQIKLAHPLLLPGQVIIGVGGISTWVDMAEYMVAGAMLVQVGTAYLQANENLEVYTDILLGIYNVVNKNVS